MSEILYLKIDRNHQVDHVDVRLGDIAKLECTDLNKKNRLKTLKLLKIQAEKSDRYIFSIMKVVELIHQIYPDLEIQNLGETDFIIEYESPEYSHDRLAWLKVWNGVRRFFLTGRISGKKMPVLPDRQQKTL